MGRGARSRLFAAKYHPFDIRPEFGCQVAGQIEPQLQRTLGESQGHRVEPARIPLVRNVGRSVSAAEAPHREGFGSTVRMRENDAAERDRKSTRLNSSHL